MTDNRGGGIPLTVVNLDELEEWVLDRTVSERDSIKEDTYDLCGRLSTQIDNILSASETLLEESEENLGREAGGGKYRASRSARRLAREITASLQGIEIPDDISYNRLKTLSNSLTRVISEIVSVRAKWEDQTTPFFLLAMRRIRREYDRLVEINREMSSFLSNRYDKAKRIEDAVRMIGEMNDLSLEVDADVDSDRKIRKEISSLNRRLKRTATELADLEKTSVATELQSIEEEAEKAERQLHSQLRGLRRPIKKLLFLVKKGRLDMKPRTVELLKRCESRIDLEQIDRIGLKSFCYLMEAMRQAIDSNRLSLKKEERTRVVRTLDAILNKGILDTELERTRRKNKKIRELLSSKEGRFYQEKKDELGIEIGKVEAERNTCLRHLKGIQKRLQEKQAEIAGIKSRIERVILDLLRERIVIELRQSPP